MHTTISLMTILFAITLSLPNQIFAAPIANPPQDETVNLFNITNPSRFTGDSTFLSQIIGGPQGSNTGLLTYALVLGGFILLFMIIQGGFTMLTNPTNPQAQEGGRLRITWAIVGFIVLFASYWIIQLLQIIFGVRIVS